MPVIIVNLPIRISKLLDDIATVARNLERMDQLAITPELVLSVQQKTLSNSSGLSADLTDKESQLLQVLANAGENGVSREVLLKEVWKMEAILDTHTLETHIYRLRKKIKDAFGDEIIKAFEGGYRL